MRKITKKGVSQIQGFLITMGIIAILIIVVIVFLGDAGSGMKEFIGKIFG